jgi:hypothetical protein
VTSALTLRLNVAREPRARFRYSAGTPVGVGAKTLATTRGL